MNFKLLAFGIAKDIVGGKTATIVSEPTVGDLRATLAKQYPKLNELRSFMIAVNNSYAADEQTISETDEIAIIPPVSGG